MKSTICWDKSAVDIVWEFLLRQQFPAKALQRSGPERKTSCERESLGIWTTKAQRHQEKLCDLVPLWFLSTRLT